jgi:adenylate cyclase
VRNRKGIKEILSGGGNNILQSDSITDAIDILKRKEIGILLINIDNPDFGGIELLQMLKEVSNVKNMYKIVITDNTSSGAKMVKGLTEGAVDFISVPFNPNLIRAKIDVYKSLYFKDQRINHPNALRMASFFLPISSIFQ